MGDHINRYVRLASGTLLLLISGLIYAWSIFSGPLGGEYGWNAGELSLCFTISMSFFCIGGFFGARLTKRRSAAFTVLCGAILMGAGFLGVALQSGQLPLLYLCYGVLAGGGVGFCYNGVMSAVTSYFPDKPGLASGVLLMGFGLGGMVLGSAAKAMMNAWGLDTTFIVLAVFSAAVCGAGSVLMNKKSGGAAAASSSGGPGKMLRSKSFWFYTLWNIFLCSAGLLVINSAAGIASAFGAAAVLGLLVSVCNGAGRVIFGHLFDRLGLKPTMYLCAGVMILAAVSLTAASMLDAVLPMFAGLLLTGMAYGGTPTASSFFARKLFGEADYAANLSILTFALIPASLIGPNLSSLLGGGEGGSASYQPIFVAMIVLAAVGLAAMIPIKTKKQ